LEVYTGSNYQNSMMLKLKKKQFFSIKMSETQSVLQKFGEEARKKIKQTQEGIQNILDKMRKGRLGLDEPESKEDEEWDYE
jgi:hypothetical protein